MWIWVILDVHFICNFYFIRIKHILDYLILGTVIVSHVNMSDTRSIKNIRSESWRLIVLLWSRTFWIALTSYFSLLKTFSLTTTQPHLYTRTGIPSFKRTKSHFGHLWTTYYLLNFKYYSDPACNYNSWTNKHVNTNSLKKIVTRNENLWK